MYKHEALSSFLLSFEGSRRIPPPGDSGSPTLTLTDRRLQYFVLPTVASHCLAHSLTPMYCRRLGGDSNLLTLQAPATTCHNFVIRLWEREEDVTSLLPAPSHNPRSPACLHILASPTCSYKSTRHNMQRA